MSFAWTTKTTTSIRIPKERKKIAAVSTETYAITHIFSSCYDAARCILINDYSMNPSTELTKECADNIAKAAAAYHKEVLGYYWKWV